jgi:hypothetical protein
LNNNTEHHRKPQQNLVAAWSSNTILNVSLNKLIKLNDLIRLNDFNSLFSLSFNQDLLIVATAQNPFSADSFKLIAEFISEGAQFTPATLQTFKLIDAFDHHQLIVTYVNTNSKISLIFGEECRTFCEGEWEQSQQLSQIHDNDRQLTQKFDNHSNAAISQRLVGIGQTGLVGLVGQIGSINLIGLDHINFVGHNNLVGIIDHNGLGGFISLGILSIIGLISFIGHIGLVDFIGLSLISPVGFVGLIGLNLVNHIGLVGFIGLGLVRLIDRISLISPIGFSGSSGLVG